MTGETTGRNHGEKLQGETTKKPRGETTKINYSKNALAVQPARAGVTRCGIPVKVSRQYIFA
jgi:hypothetical protein